MAGVWTGLFGAKVHAVILLSTPWLSPRASGTTEELLDLENRLKRNHSDFQIVTSDCERAQPTLAGEGCQLASSCVSPSPCFPVSQAELLGLLDTLDPGKPSSL